jgi:Uma2 family endonuclease
MKPDLQMATTLTMAGAQFDALPYEEGRKWELIDRELVEVPSPTPKHQMIVGTVYASLRAYLLTSPIGGVLPDVEFALSDSDRVRPDVCVLLGEQWTALDKDRIPIPGAPNIAVEVISPSERTADSTRKVWTCLRAGVEEVWQIYPESSSVAIYASSSPVRVLNAGDSLRTELLPGWEMLVRDIVASA